MVLWVFCPSFCTTLVPIEAIPSTVVNVFIALCGSTIATNIASDSIRGKINATDIANATLAAAVAIAAVYDFGFTYLMLILINLISPVKATEEKESLGIDQALHGKKAYDEGSL